MFNYVVVFVDGRDIEINKCESMNEVSDVIINKLREDHTSGVVGDYIDHIRDEVEQDWYWSPMSVEDYVKEVLIDDHSALEDYGIYWE